MVEIQLEELGSDEFSEYTKTYLLNQRLDLSEEEAVVIHPYKVKYARELVLTIAEILSLGLFKLFLLWFPQYRASWTSQPCGIDDIEYVEVIDQKGNSSIEKVYKRSFKETIPTSNAQLPVLKSIPCFNYKSLKLYLNVVTVEWVMLSSEAHAFQLYASQLNYFNWGLNTQTVSNLRQTYGQNLLKLEEKSIMRILIHEVLHPFYIFQLFSIVLWLLDNFFFYSCCIFMISLCSIYFAIKESKDSDARVHSIIGESDTFTVIRDKRKKQVCGDELVTGDLICLTNDERKTCPVDGLVLSGSCLVDESMLTGESVPANKYALEELSLDSFIKNAFNVFSSHVLHAGTKFLQVNSTLEMPCYVITIRTGFSSRRGKLIRDLLYPKMRVSQLYKDSMSFLKLMIIFSLFSVFFLSLYLFKYNAPFSHIIIRSLDVITILIPPALPATLSIGIANAVYRLSQGCIFTSNPECISTAGNIDTFVFDKTGTITEENVQLSHSYVKDTQNNLEVAQNAHQFSMSKTLISNISTCCQSLQIVDGNIIGDPLELALFNYFNGRFINSFEFNVRPRDALFTVMNGKDGQEIAYSVTRSLEFDPVLRRMSVIAVGNNKKTPMLFSKGAPESILDICSSRTIPNNLYHLLEILSFKGFRILACAWKPLKSETDLQQISRGSLERDLVFEGLLVFESKIKKESRNVMNVLNKANMHIAVCSGDSLWTSVYVARQSGVFGSSLFVYVEDSEEKYELIRSTDDEVKFKLYNVKEDCYLSTAKHTTFDYILSDENSAIAITGGLLRKITESFGEEKLRSIIKKTKVLARMSPSEKSKYVELCRVFQSNVGFCGDGANDCLALRRSDVSVSLSDTEACAAASFISQKKSVLDIIAIMLEGRCSIVTSYRCFQYMVMSAIIQFSGTILLYLRNYNYNDSQFLFMDLAIVFPLSAAMSHFAPSDIITSNAPSSTLFKKPSLFLLGLLSGVVLSSQWLLDVLLVKLDSTSLPTWQAGKSNTENALVSCSFLLTCLQYVGVNLIINRKSEFLSPIWKNKLYVSSSIIIGVVCLFICFLNNQHWVSKVLHIVSLPISYRFIIVLLGTIPFLVVYLFL
ncbi:Ca2/Mn2 transporting P-type ATPase P5 type Cta5 [Schizosaccharomyces cryophilus OY26]|uniref:Cation-transporting ATPase n=1 Tax=Schizosaccharomyces cryophilus (strain OY26 / ATCC MYA-4695 / CBS 11777 / NBRC 106824 / NRRL Y48691) TaxID=653667 RepID=S9X8T0_SCHCR|nr:Ca2/Mn2 transporting P-type ATPase P5 type Cta5 [Schizosaccharomyces cryophilus OY26]EPY50241.1 Ca2/Mn2 transporting P-type ATPase P5 type Cta5 [Schizosaccharomyces cryophilus OY26]